jgi:hypothetical protein
VDWAELFGNVGDWLSIGPVILLPGLIILVPGFLLSRLLRVRPFDALAVAMPATIGMYFLLGVLYLFIGVNFNALTVGLGVIILLSLVHLILQLTRSESNCLIMFNRRFYWSGALVLLLLGMTLFIVSNTLGSIQHYFAWGDYYFHFHHVAQLAEFQNIFGLNWNYPSGGHFLILFTAQIGNVGIFAAHKLVLWWTFFAFGGGVVALARKMFTVRRWGLASGTGLVFTLMMINGFLRRPFLLSTVFAHTMATLQIPAIVVLTLILSERALKLGVNCELLSKVTLAIFAYAGILSSHYAAGAFLIVISTLIIALRRTLPIWAGALVMLCSGTLWLYLSHAQFARQWYNWPNGIDFQSALRYTFVGLISSNLTWLGVPLLILSGLGMVVALRRLQFWLVIVTVIPLVMTMIRLLSPSESYYLNYWNELLNGIFYVDIARVQTFAYLALWILSMYGFTALANKLLDSPRLKTSSMVVCTSALGLFVYAVLPVFVPGTNHWEQTGLTKAEENFVKQVARFVPEHTGLDFDSFQRGLYIFPLTGVGSPGIYNDGYYTPMANLFSRTTNQTLCEDYVSPPHRPIFIIQFGESEADPRTAFVDSEGEPLPLEVKLSDGENNLFALNCQTVVDEI